MKGTDQWVLDEVFLFFFNQMVGAMAICCGDPLGCSLCILPDCENYATKA